LPSGPIAFDESPKAAAIGSHHKHVFIVGREHPPVRGPIGAVALSEFPDAAVAAGLDDVHDPAVAKECDPTTIR
jgi:hypothetical protein